MVKRYNPSTKAIYSQFGDNAVEIVPKMKKDPNGDYVSFEAYRLLEKKHAKLFYGNECVKIASSLKIPYEKLQDIVLDYCLDHYKHFQCYPMDMVIDDRNLVSFEAMMEILEYSEKNDEEKVLKIKEEKDSIF